MSDGMTEAAKEFDLHEKSVSTMQNFSMCAKCDRFGRQSSMWDCTNCYMLASGIPSRLKMMPGSIKVLERGPLGISPPKGPLELEAGYAVAARQVGGVHYKDMKIQPMTYILANNLNFPEGNIVKYISRCKGGKRGRYLDLHKVIQNAEFLLADEFPEGEPKE